MAEPIDWIVVFRIKFDTEVDATETQFKPNATAEIWRFGPENVPLDEFGLPVFKAAVWGGIAVFKCRNTAQRYASNPQSMFAEPLEAIEIWSALLEPITHRGQVNWLGDSDLSTVFETSESKPSEPLAVITSAGFASQEPEDLPRIERFTTGSKKVLEQFKQHSDLMAGAIFYSMYDGLDGITFTLWPSARAMQNSAYEVGLHSDYVREHRQLPMADRISNTRANVVESFGTWDGANPIQETLSID